MGITFSLAGITCSGNNGKGKDARRISILCSEARGENGKLFNCHKFRTMTVKHNGSTVSVAGDSRITPFGATLRHYKLDVTSRSLGCTDWQYVFRGATP